MSVEFVRVVLSLSFLGMCGLVGQILVQSHREDSPRRDSLV